MSYGFSSLCFRDLTCSFYKRYLLLKYKLHRRDAKKKHIAIIVKCQFPTHGGYHMIQKEEKAKG